MDAISDKRGNGKVAYFAPDLADPAVHRRIAQLRHAGRRVHAFAFARDPAMAELPGCVSLGPLAHGSRLTRLVALVRALLKLSDWRQTLIDADLYIARNLDNAVLALFIRRMTGSSAPIVYEVLDINGSCVGQGLSARMMRGLEGWLLNRIDLLVVSSPSYISEYYIPYFDYGGRWMLLENKVPRHASRAHVVTERTRRPGIWTIGWFGFLDDERSWRALRRLAERFPNKIAIYVRGRPYADFNTERFLDDVARLKNVVYGGPYRSPDDLSSIYQAVDIVWSADLNALNGNSRWLLTNATYEALYFKKPILSLSGTAVGDFVNRHGAGWCIEEPVEEALGILIGRLSEDEYRTTCATISAIPRACFVEADEIEQLVNLGEPLHGSEEIPGEMPGELKNIVSS